MDGKIYKGGMFFLVLLFVCLAYAGPAHAASPYFKLNPSVVGTTQPFFWPTQYDTNGIYPRDIYWDFTKNPFAPGDPNEINFGASSPSDKFTKTGAVQYFSSTDQVGLNGRNQSGTVSFSFDPTKFLTSGNMLYVWAEIQITTTGSSRNNYVSFAGLNNVTSSELFDADTGGTVLEKDATGLFSPYHMTGGPGGTTYDAYFSIFDPSHSLEDLTLDLNTRNGTAFINNFQVAMTPEPLPMALFAVGAAVLFFRRRQVALQRE